LLWKQEAAGYGLKVHLKKEVSGKEGLLTKKTRIQAFLFKAPHISNAEFLHGELKQKNPLTSIKVRKYPKIPHGKSYKRA
tara:strand:+ start:1827 stop:2066 length:240 start_codon:yes stop_codon:yes gene_type:complete